MTNETFSAIGMVLTFLASMSATLVSIKSLKCSNKTAKRTGYLNTITASRKKMISALRENASMYFTQISRICNCQEENLDEIYNELTRYHYAVILLFNKHDKKTHDRMDYVRSYALDIVEANKKISTIYKNNFDLFPEEIEELEEIKEARNIIRRRRNSIYYEQSEIFPSITNIILRERNKQEQEAINL